MSDPGGGSEVAPSGDVPDGATPPVSGGTTSTARVPWIVMAGVIAVVAAGAGAAALIQNDEPPVAASSPSASAVATASLTATAEPTPSSEPSAAEATTIPDPTAAQTLGPITRWATAASFGSEGAAEEVRDITYGGGNFVAVGFREPLVARGQVGPLQHDPLVWISSDGASWEALQLGSVFDGAHLFAATTLPDGAAAIYGYVDRDPDPNMEEIEAAAWRSMDAKTWTRFELVLPARPDAETPSYRTIGAIASGAGGYLTVDGYATEEGLVDLVLYSSDGARWEVAAHFGPDGSGWTDGLRDYAAGDEGFVLVGERYEIDAEQRVYLPIVRASADGRTWIDADPEAMPEGPNLLVAAVEGDWIATQTDFEAGTDVTWFSHDGVTWEERASLDVPDPPGSEEFGEGNVSVIGTIIEAGDRAIISGAHVYCCHSPWYAAGIWSSFDAASWERLGFPDDAVIGAAAWHDGVTVLAGHTGASPTADWQARATFWVSERD